METLPTTVPEVIIEVIDYTAQLNDIYTVASLIADASVLISGMMTFLVAGFICYFVYKFFRIFF